jgi:SAM-dependent methyltransferase
MSAEGSSRPGYAEHMDMRGLSAAAAPGFAGQVLLTCAQDLPKPPDELDVLDVGSGYGFAAAVLAESCRSVVGMEPTSELHAEALALAEGRPNLRFVHAGVGALDAEEQYDLIVLDNVYEHLASQDEALARMHRALRPGGVLYMLMPNRLWPLEVHYGLPFLSWLPLRAANVYLRWSGRGTDYTDASYARTYWTLRRSLGRHDWSWRFALPADPGATHAGTPLHYRLGMAAIRRWPALWAVSKSFLVVVRKPA